MHMVQAAQAVQAVHVVQGGAGGAGGAGGGAGEHLRDGREGGEQGLRLFASQPRPVDRVDHYVDVGGQPGGALRGGVRAVACEVRERRPLRP